MTDRPIVDLLAEAVRDADRHGIPDVEPALLASSDDIDESWLDCKTTTPSGKTVGIVRLGSARLFMDEHDLAVVGDDEKPAKVVKDYDVDVWISGSGTITVRAEDIEDAEEQAREWALSDVEVDVDVSARPFKGKKKRPQKRGAA